MWSRLLKIACSKSPSSCHGDVFSLVMFGHKAVSLIRGAVIYLSFNMHLLLRCWIISTRGSITAICINYCISKTTNDKQNKIKSVIAQDYSNICFSLTIEDLTFHFTPLRKKVHQVFLSLCQAEMSQYNWLIDMTPFTNYSEDCWSAVSLLSSCGNTTCLHKLNERGREK